MRVLHKPVDMVWESNPKEEFPKLFRFRVPASEDNEEPQVFKITSIIGKGRNRIEKQDYIRYLCKVASNGIERPAEIWYDLMKTTWILYKI